MRREVILLTFAGGALLHLLLATLCTIGVVIGEEVQGEVTEFVLCLYLSSCMDRTREETAYWKPDPCPGPVMTISKRRIPQILNLTS